MSDYISRQDAINAILGITPMRNTIPLDSAIFNIKKLPSAQPEYYDYSDIEDTWNYYAEENDINLTANAKQIKNAMWVGYRKGKESAQTERKKGEWIRHTRVEPVYSLDGVETWGIKCQCNKCCFVITVVEDFGYYSFCPNCGARMEVKSC